jgi:hypothetical protein
MRYGYMVAGLCFTIVSASAAEMPTRKPGLWEVKMTFSNRQGPTLQQCTDATTDEMMHAGPGVAQQCSKRDIQTSGNTMTVDSICTINGKTSATHMVVVGSFDSAYTMTVAIKDAGGAPPAAGETAQPAVTMEAKWLGPCKADQKPGDMIMPGGMKMNVRDLQNMRPPAGAPAAPR